MAFHNENTVLTGDVIVTWDGLSKPEHVPATSDKAATEKYKLSFAFPANAPEYGEMYQLIQAAIAKQYPHGAPPRFQEAFGNPNESKKIPEVEGMVGATASTFGDFPNVFDMNGQMLDQASVARVLYAGAKVRLLVSPRIYDNNGNKGATFWLSGVQIRDANPATAPKLAVSAGMTAGQVADAFGIASPGAAFAPAAAPGMPPVPGAPAAPGYPAPGMPPAAPAAAPGMPPPVPGAPAAPGYPAPPAAPAPAPTAVHPNPGILAGGVGAPPVPGVPPVPAAPAAPAAPVRQMLPAAGGVPYESYIAQGWTDALLVQHGMMAPLA
ncbi:hypothetical protein B2_20 [Stenotrophomonas phage B2]|nr:hypothetical protein B2_20 [Stenotrophomonas phage B2]